MFPLPIHREACHTTRNILFSKLSKNDNNRNNGSHLNNNSRITLSLPTIQKEISSNMISSFGSPYRSTTFNCIPKAFTTGNSFISRYFRYQHFLPTSEISSLVRLLVSSASDHLLRRMCHQSHLGRLPVLVVGLPSCSSQSHKPPVHIAIMYYKRRSFHSIPFERT